MDFITAIVQGIGEAMTTFVPSIGQTLVDGFASLFWITAGEGTTAGLTLLGQGLLAVAGISLSIGAIVMVYKIFRGRLRHRM